MSDNERRKDGDDDLPTVVDDALMCRWLGIEER